MAQLSPTCGQSAFRWRYSEEERAGQIFSLGVVSKPRVHYLRVQNSCFLHVRAPWRIPRTRLRPRRRLASRTRVYIRAYTPGAKETSPLSMGVGKYRVSCRMALAIRTKWRLIHPETLVTYPPFLQYIPPVSSKSEISHLSILDRRNGH